MNQISGVWDGSYRAIEWIFLFYVYSILGWVWESIYMSILERKPLNRGFLYGPCIPLYGAGATTVLICTMPYKDKWWVVALLGMVAATILEEITGRVMERVFDVRYWTYEGYPGNIDGIICIPATLLWGVFSLFAMYILNPPFEHLLHQIPMIVVYRFVYICSILFAVDVTLSIKNALDFKEVLWKMANGRDELVRLKKRLDVMIAFYDDKHQYVARLKQSFGNGRDVLSDMLESVKIRLEIMEEIRRSRKSENMEQEDEELSELPELQNKFAQQENTVHFYSIPFKKYIRHLLYSNPKARIKRIGLSLKELAGSVRNHLPSHGGGDKEDME